MSRCIGCEFVVRVLPPASGSTDERGAIGDRANEAGAPASHRKGGRHEPRGASRQRASESSGRVRSWHGGRFAADESHTAALATQRGTGSGAAAVDERAASERLRELSRVADAGRLREEIWSRGRGRTGGHGLADLAGIPEHKGGKGQDGCGVFRKRRAGS